MTNSVDPDQAAPIGAVWSGSTLFASVLEFVNNVRKLFAADDFSRRHFSDAFFLGALRVNIIFSFIEAGICPQSKLLVTLKRYEYQSCCTLPSPSSQYRVDCWFIVWCTSHCLWDFCVCRCFVMHYCVPILVFQSSWRGRESLFLCYYCLTDVLLL